MNKKESGVIKCFGGLKIPNSGFNVSVNGKKLCIKNCQCCNRLGNYKVESGSNNLVCVYCGSKQYY
mgnify:CR=1